MLKFCVDAKEPGKSDLVGLGLSHENLRRLRSDAIQFHGTDVGLGSGVFVIAHLDDPQLQQYKRLFGTHVCELVVLSELACKQLETTATVVNVPLTSKRTDRPCEALVFAGSTEEALVESMKAAGLITPATSVTGPSPQPSTPAMRKKVASVFPVSLFNRLKLAGGGVGFIVFTVMMAMQPHMVGGAVALMAVTAAVLLGMAAWRWTECVEIDDESIRCNRRITGFEMRWRDVAKIEARRDSLGPYEIHLVGRAGERHKLHRIYAQWDALVDAITSRH